ncbi:MAG: N-acetylmuramoyl-L-alanine amidase [Gammaproteobacteria bacterium]|nr:N-acetylmuramoyl-L-alanine amidase [Gammaproteobacteria bacterium]
MNKFSLLLLALSSLTYANEISFFEVKNSDSESTEISFLLSKVSFIKSYSLVDPSRIVIDVYQSDLKSDVQKKYNYPIKQIRASSKEDLTRIVIDLYEYVAWSKPTQEKTDGGILLKIKIKKNKNLKNNIRDIVVAIDAGHGGKDPGAVSSNNVLEKDITLLIAKELERTLRDTEGYQAVLIRDDDSTVSLNDRYQNARRYGADAFVSIHADGFRLSSVKGASVFIWSEESSSSVARNLSDKERSRIQAQIKNLKTYDFNEDAARDLYPDTYKKKIDQSKILGTKILDQLKRDPFTKIHKQNVEYADFRVLKSVDIPSVLVESGFITNPEDAKRLKTKAGRRMIARSIFLGIHNYFKEDPVSGSVLENYSNYLNYEIQKGDVLSEVAIRFGVTVDSINNLNNLKNKPIYPNQIIKIEI